MLEDVLEPYKTSIKRADLLNASYKSFRLRCPSMQIDTILNWESPLSMFETYLKSIINKFMAVLFNGAVLNQNEAYNETSLSKFVDINFVNLTPESKLEGILDYISAQTSFDGESIEIQMPSIIKISQMYFNNAREWRFYLDSSVSAGFLHRIAFKKDEDPQYGPSRYRYNLTVNGLTRLIQLNELRTSKYGFVAMAFQSDMFNVLEIAIKPALMSTGFNHYVVSEDHIESDKTLNDAIIAGIKKARFTIADFTYHRGGVYFEAGYALGRGQKVIYTCREDEMNKAHFDIRNYQHIVWSNADDFKRKLIDKIEAFIKD